MIEAKLEIKKVGDNPVTQIVSTKFVRQITGHGYGRILKDIKFSTLFNHSIPNSYAIHFCTLISLAASIHSVYTVQVQCMYQ